MCRMSSFDAVLALLASLVGGVTCASLGGCTGKSPNSSAAEEAHETGGGATAAEGSSAARTAVKSQRSTSDRTSVGAGGSAAATGEPTTLPQQGGVESTPSILPVSPGGNRNEPTTGAGGPVTTGSDPASGGAGGGGAPGGSSAGADPKGDDATGSRTSSGATGGTTTRRLPTGAGSNGDLETGGAVEEPGGFGGASDPEESGGGQIGASGGGPSYGGAAGSGGVAWTDIEPVRHTLTIAGKEREYYVWLPEGYDGSRSYRLLLAWHGTTGTGWKLCRRDDYRALRGLSAGTMIVVAPTALGTAEDPADTVWRDIDGEDVAFARAILDWMQTGYRIDQERVFSMGLSYGGVMANMVGCALGEQVRAIVSIGGTAPEGAHAPTVDPCLGQEVAAWVAHGLADTVVPFDVGVRTRDYWLAVNGCAASTLPLPIVGSLPEDEGYAASCVTYEGCAAEYPVHWCEHSGGHSIEAWMPGQIWEFLSQL